MKAFVLNDPLFSKKEEKKIEFFRNTVCSSPSRLRPTKVLEQVKKGCKKRGGGGEEKSGFYFICKGD